MVVYVGINPRDGKVAIYSTVDGNLTTIDVEKVTPDDVEKVDNFFTLIKKYLTQEINATCICLDGSYCNEIRLAFIKNASENNFQNCAIIDFNSALYYRAVFKSTFKSKNGDKIGIVATNRCYLFKHTEDKIVFIEACPYQTRADKTIVETLESPTAMFFDEKDKSVIDFCTKSKTFFYSHFCPEYGALIKATLMANNQDLLNVKTNCGRKIVVLMNNKQLLTVISDEKIPYLKVLKVVQTEQTYILKIIEKDTVKKQLKMNRHSFVFSINSNGIYSIKNLDVTIIDASLDIQSTKSQKELSYNKAVEPLISENKKTKPVRFTNFEITGNLQSYVESMREIGHIQTEINILQTVISNVYSDFSFANIQRIQLSHDSCNSARSDIGNSLVQIQTKYANFAGSESLYSQNFKDSYDSAISQYSKLQNDYKNTQQFLRDAEMYLINYNIEMKWLNEAFLYQEIHVENFENAETALKIYKKLSLEQKAHEKDCQNVILQGQQLIKKVKQNSVTVFINQFTRKWEEFKEFMDSYSKIVKIIQKTVECHKTAKIIEEWLKMRYIIVESTKVLEKSLDLMKEVEDYSYNIVSFETETNMLTNEILINGNLIKSKLSVFFNVLLTHKNDIQKSYLKLKFKTFIYECMALKAQMEDQIKILNAINDDYHFQECLNKHKNLQTSFAKILNYAEKFKAENRKYICKIENEIQEIISVHKILTNSISNKSQEFDSQKEIEQFFYAAREAINILEIITTRIETINTSKLPLNFLKEQHVKLEACYIENEESIKNAELKALKILEKDSTLENVQEALLNIRKAGETMNSKWQSSLDKCDIMQKFNEKFEESVNLVKTIPNFEKNVTTKLPKKYFIPKKIDIYDVSINVIGIDLGTTRCCMGINRNNKIEIVAIENTGGRLLPSFVSFEEEEANCGKTVLERLEKNKAKYTCFDIKLIIGKSFFDVVVDESWPFEIIEENEKVMIKTEDKNGEVLKSPEEISAVLLKHMRDKAVEFQGQDVLEAVITIPAAYNESQKQATLEAAKLAGWENITLLPEPIAASFAYFNNREIPDNSNVLLFDLGGGTLNICLFKIYGNEIVIISDIGDTCLGGRDIDNLLIDYFTRVLEIRHNVFINTKRKYKLMLKCQKLKQNLSQSEIEYLDVNDFDSDIYEKIEFSRFELEKMMAKMIARMRTKINDVLSTANLIHTEIHKVLQVGGGCRMPVVKQMLKNMFKNAEHCVEEHPDEVVAVGAAIYAYHLATICT